MGNHRRALWNGMRRLVETPAIGPALFRLNVSAPVMGKMMRAHVHGEPSFVSAERFTAKTAVNRRAGARFATAAFVTGGLDLVHEQGMPFFELFGPPACRLYWR
jgi:hypothetical protein